MSGTRKAHAISKICQLPTVEAVVIGCSAGGLSALQVVLAGLPKGVDAAFIIVAHTPPDGDNLLPKLLDSYCALPVSEAIEREPVIPGRVYIAPPNYHLLIEADHTFARWLRLLQRYSPHRAQAASLSLTANKIR